MSNDQVKMMAGSARSAKVSDIVVLEDTERVNQAAEVATTVIMQKFGIALGATFTEVCEVNVIGLRVALMKAADGDAKIPKGALVPSYFDSMIKGMTTKIGRTVLSTGILQSDIVLPGHYKTTVMKMKVAGVPFVTPHRPALESSQTLAYGKENVDEVECITGNLLNADIADLVRRDRKSVV